MGSLVFIGTYLVCARLRILLGIYGAVLWEGVGLVVTIPLMHLNACTLPSREEDSERILALATVTRYGPAYNRAVAENIGKYMLMINKGEEDSAEYFLGQAERALAYAREKEKK